MEAQDLIDKKMAEIEEMQYELKEKDQNIEIMRNQLFECKLQVSNSQNLLNEQMKATEEEARSYSERIAQLESDLEGKIGRI